MSLQTTLTNYPTGTYFNFYIKRASCSPSIVLKGLNEFANFKLYSWLQHSYRWNEEGCAQMFFDIITQKRIFVSFLKCKSLGISKVEIWLKLMWWSSNCDTFINLWPHTIHCGRNSFQTQASKAPPLCLRFCITITTWNRTFNPLK